MPKGSFAALIIVASYGVFFALACFNLKERKPFAFAVTAAVTLIYGALLFVSVTFVARHGS